VARQAQEGSLGLLLDKEIRAAMQLAPESLRVVPDCGLPREEEGSLRGDWLALFRSSAPYVAMFQRCIMVFHVPCHLLEEAFRPDLLALLEDIRLCALLGVHPVLVASPEQRVLERMAASGGRGGPKARETEGGGGLLDVDDEMLRLLKQEAGFLCTELESLFGQLARGGRPSATVYSSSQLFSTLPRRTPRGEICGRLGRVHEVASAQIHRWLDGGDLVLLTPLGAGPAEGLRYVPSEEVALEAAKQLKASKLIFLTRGQRIVDTRRDSIVPAMELRDARAFADYAAGHPELFSDVASGEVLRYLELIVQALGHGVRRGHLIDPRQGAVLQELYTTDGSGTLISQDLYDGLGLAYASDVPAIVELTEPLVRKGLLKRRSNYELRSACNRRQMFVWKRENIPTGCALLQRFADEPETAELGCFVVAPHCRGKGHGTVLLSYVERVAQLSGVRKLFLLTTQTMQWFIEKGFSLGSLEDLPLEKQRNYDMGRSSRIYVKWLDDLPSEVHDRFTLVEVDTLD